MAKNKLLICISLCNCAASDDDVTWWSARVLWLDHELMYLSYLLKNLLFLLGLCAVTWLIIKLTIKIVISLKMYLIKKY